MKLPSWIAPLVVVVILGFVAADLISNGCAVRRERELQQSEDSLAAAIDSLITVIDSLGRDTVVVTRIVRIADSSRHQAEEAETAGDTVAASAHWKSAYESEHAARLILEGQVATYRGTIVPALGTQLSEALRQRDEWKKSARVPLFSLKRIRPVAGCVTNGSGGTCGLGVAYTF